MYPLDRILVTAMQWNKPLNPAELVSFRQCVIAALPPTQQVDLAKQFRNILLTDKRVKYLIGAIKQQAFTKIETKIKWWYDEDIQGCVTPKLLARDWFDAKNNQPLLWKIVAILRYPADLREVSEPTIVGIRLHDIWERRSIKCPSIVRTWLYNTSLVFIKKSVELD